MLRRIHRTLLIAVCLSVPALGGVLAQEGAALPGGASSLQETYQDWLVSCVQQNGKRCALAQRTQQNGQQVMAIELVPAGDGETATGTLVLPFGLALDAGVALQADDNPAGAPLRFSTCLSGGCLVPLSLDAALLDGMRGGETLKVMSKAADSDRAVPLSVSLKGFGAAFDRVNALAK
jgi:invasion protein IalB